MEKVDFDGDGWMDMWNVSKVWIASVDGKACLVLQMRPGRLHA